MTTLRDALLRGKRRPRRANAGAPVRFRGDGYEFVELRGYVEGDDVRRIDWAASARAGGLQTRVMLEDIGLSLAVILDESPSMEVGRTRTLRDAARDACEAFAGAARPGDRVVRVDGGALRHPRAQSTAAFSLSQALRTARRALPRGTALLAISDWFDLGDDDRELLAELGAWCDCTALYARDPWYDGLPLRGMVRLRGAEGGMLRTFIGRRERQNYARAVRARESELATRFERAGWRSAPLLEADGVASLRAAFGLRA